MDISARRREGMDGSARRPEGRLSIPVKHGEGRYYAPPGMLDELEANGQVALRYAPGQNPNGSLRDIAGVSNERGNVVGLMPHPEHATEPGFGPDMPDAMRSGVDGLRFFQSVIEHTLARF